jgi:hypothetical protein
MLRLAGGDPRGVSNDPKQNSKGDDREKDSKQKSHHVDDPRAGSVPRYRTACAPTSGSARAVSSDRGRRFSSGVVLKIATQRWII